jgi:hypothetical protein
MTGSLVTAATRAVVPVVSLVKLWKNRAQQIMFAAESSPR